MEDKDLFDEIDKLNEEQLRCVLKKLIAEKWIEKKANELLAPALEKLNQYAQNVLKKAK